MLGTQAGLWTFLFVAVVAGGVREELQRAFLLHRFRTSLGGPAVGLVATSVAFGLGHTLQGWDAAVVTGALGALWAAMYLGRGSAVAPIVSHGLFNSAELLRASLLRGLAP
jgi:membrane protease YdiL (CAAX protease family)